MKRIYSLLMLVVVLFCAGNAMAAAVDILTFPDNNDTGVGSYTATWTATTNEKIWTISGFNNNNNKEWAFIKSGSNKTETTSTITTPAYDVAVSDIVFTVDFTGFVTSATVEVLNGEEVVSTVDIYNQWKKGEVDAKVSGAAGNSYRLTIVNAQTVSNGMTQISQVAVYEAGEYTAPTVEDLTAVDNKFWNFSDFTAGDITEPTVVDNLELYGTSSKKFTIDSNNKSIDDIDFTGRLKTGGTGAPDGRYIRFKVAPNSVITVYGMSGSSGNERTLNIDFVQFGLNEASLVNDGNAIGKVEYEYTGTEEADVYIYSTNSGFNIYGIKVEAIKYTVNVSASENGTVEADVTEAAAGATVKLTVTPAEGCVLYALNVKYLDEAAEQEVSVSDDNSFVMPAADVTVTAEFRAKNEPGEYDNTPLTKDMFKGWDGFDDYAKVNKENPYWNASELPADIGGGATVFGSSNVTNTDYADITGAETLRITGTPGIQLRVMFNRQSDNSLTELNPTIGEEGYVDVDLSEYEYVHLNAIKTGWNSVAGTVESMILNPGEEEPQVEVPEIINPSFELAAEDTPLTEELKASNGALSIYGWTETVDGSFNNTEIRAAGSASTTSQFGTSAPSDGEYALFFRHGWNGGGVTTTLTSAALSTLPAGSYKLSVDFKHHYSYDNSQNSNTTLGIAMMNGETELGSAKSEGAAGVQGSTADATYFNDSDWSTLTASFTVEEDVEGATVVISFNSAGQRRSDYFIDNVKLEVVSEEEVAKDELGEAIEAATASNNYVTGENLFQYPESEIQPLTDAIATAQAVYDKEDATAEEINSATETLNNFVAEFAPQQNEPEEGQAYTITQKTSGLELLLDGGVKISENGSKIYFVKQDDGSYAITADNAEYANYTGTDTNTWTMGLTADAYGWTFTALPDGDYLISGKNGYVATDNITEGSATYGNKAANNANGVWGIAEAEEEQFVLGDVNDDQKVSIVDATMTVEFVLEKATPTEKQKKAADVDGDDAITVADAAAIVNIIMDYDYTASGVKAREFENNDHLVLNGNSIALENSNSYVAFQMDVTVEGEFNGAMLSARAADHRLSYNQIGENKYRIVVLSASNNAISGNAGELISLNVNGNYELTNVRFVDLDINTYHINIGGETTGINAIRSLQADAEGIYTLGGAKVNALQKGVNIVRKADGTAVKVFVK